MSSPRCSSVSAHGLHGMLPGVVADVAEQMFFGWTDVCEPADADELIRLVDGSPHERGWLEAQVRFFGAIGGSLHVMLPYSLARDLGSAMTGRPVDTLTTEMLSDLAGELANVICGALLTRSEQIERFEALPPIVRRRGAPVLTSGATHSCFRVNDGPLVVTLSLVAA